MLISLLPTFSLTTLEIEEASRKHGWFLKTKIFVSLFCFWFRFSAHESENGFPKNHQSS